MLLANGKIKIKGEFDFWASFKALLWYYFRKLASLKGLVERGQLRALSWPLQVSHENIRKPRTDAAADVCSLLVGGLVLLLTQFLGNWQSFAALKIISKHEVLFLVFQRTGGRRSGGVPRMSSSMVLLPRVFGRIAPAPQMLPTQSGEKRERGTIFGRCQRFGTRRDRSCSSQKVTFYARWRHKPQRILWFLFFRNYKLFENA